MKEGCSSFFEQAVEGREALRLAVDTSAKVTHALLLFYLEFILFLSNINPSHKFSQIPSALQKFESIYPESAGASGP